MEFERPTESRVKLELTPLIDVIFQLLAFFMLSSTFMYPAVDLRLPALSRDQDPAKPQKLVVSVDKDGKYYINTEPVAASELPEKIKKSLDEMQEKSIFIRVDTHVAYGKFMEIMEISRKAGALNFHLLYEPTN